MCLVGTIGSDWTCPVVEKYKIPASVTLFFVRYIRCDGLRVENTVVLSTSQLPSRSVYNTSSPPKSHLIFV